MDSTGKPKSVRRRTTWLGVVGFGVSLALLLCMASISVTLRTDSIPQAAKAPPEALLAFLHSPEATSEALRAAAHPLWDRPDPPNSMEEYLRFQLEKDPDNEGAKLYLEMADRFEKDGIVHGFGEAFPGNQEHGWRPGPAMSESQLQWLNGHQDYIDLMRRMAASGGPPMPTPEEVPRDNYWKRMKFPVPNFLLMQSGAKILVAESARRRSEGRFAEAAKLDGDAYALGGVCINQFLIGDLIRMVADNIANRSLSGWLSEDPPPLPVLESLAQRLDAHHSVARRRTMNMASELLGDRVLGLNAASSTTMTIGYAVLIAEKEDSRSGEEPGAAKTLLHILEAAFRAPAIKRNATKDLAAFDAYLIAFMKAAREPYSDFVAYAQQRIPVRPGLFNTTMARPDYIEYMTRSVISEANMNLNRAALRLLQGETPPPPQDDRDGDEWLRSAWRDPFTEAPLKIVDETSSTLIYSLGPDMKDQAGAVAYDPSNGTISAGDLALRIPKGRSN